MGNVFFPDWKPDPRAVIMWRDNYIPMFACGALLATTFFLIVPEANHLIQSEFADPHAGHGHRYLEEDEPAGEAATTWRWGVSIMGGFLIPVITQIFMPHNHGHEEHGHSHSKNIGEIAKADDIEEKSKTKEEIPTDDAQDVASTNKEHATIICGCVRCTNVSLMVSICFADFMHNFA